MPLPTNATFARASSGAQVSLTSRGGLAEPRPTPRMPPQPSSASSSGPRTSISTFGFARPVRFFASASTPSANIAGSQVVGRRVHPVAGLVHDVRDGLRRVQRRDRVLTPRGVAEDRDVGDARVVRLRLVALERVAAERNPSATARTCSASWAGRASATEAALPMLRAATPAARRTRSRVRASRVADSDDEQLSGLDRATGRHPQHLAGLAAEAHRAEHRLELAAVLRGDVLGSRAGDQVALGRLGDTDHHQVGAGLGGAALAERVRRHDGPC